MESATKADLKELLAEFHREFKQSIRQSISEAFDVWKPAIESQASGLQVAVDLFPQHVCRDKGDGVEKASPADPLDPLALMASTSPPTTTGDIIPVLVAAVTSDKIVDGEAASATAAVNSVVPNDRATPAIIERGLEIILSACSGFTTTLPATCLMGCHLDTNRDTSLANTNICVTEVAAPALSERIPMSVVLQGSSSSASILKESPEDIHSASNRFITTVPITYSTGCLPQRWMYAQVLVASPTEYSIDNNISAAVVPLAMRCECSSILTPTVHVQRPRPWPSLMSVYADGDEARPLPWPSFKDMKGHQFHNVAGEKASWLCNSHSPHAEVCVATMFNISDFCGNLFSSTGYLIPHDLCNSYEWRCLDDVLFFLQHLGSVSDCVQSAHRYQPTLACLSYNILVLCLLVMIRSLELKVLSIGLKAVNLPTVLLDSGNFAWNFEYLGVHTTVCIGTWLLVGCLRVCWKYSVQSATHYSLASACVSQLHRTMNYSQLKMLVTAAGHRMIVAGFPKRQMSSHMLLLSWVWEQEELHLGFQFQLCSILPDCYLGNQSIMVREYPDYSLKHNSLADTWRSWLLCVRSVCATIDVVVWPHGQCSRSWHSPQPGIARDALLMLILSLIRSAQQANENFDASPGPERPITIIQSASLKYMDLCWLTTAILTEVFSTWFSLHMNITCSVKPILLLTHAYQLSIWAPTMFTFAWRNLNCIFGSYTARCALQVTGSELLDSTLDCLFNGIKESQKSWNSGISQSNVFNAYQLDFFGNLGGTKKHPLSWDPRGRYVTGLNRHMVLQLPWDPGIAAAAWGQAAFEGGRGVSNLLLCIDMGRCMGHRMGSAHLSATPYTVAVLQRPKALRLGRHPSWITNPNPAAAAASEPTSSLLCSSIPALVLVIRPESNP